ncbi:MuF-like minor capsid protein [Gordonia Phage Zitch]|uniref:MuF-like minor capsid protein n=1 Tax=Gordonia Phage Zitch TaxID=2743909 RepID=A0A7G3VBH9_9CAUD|nr:head morphogenesis [Gordonia Phage Zitch]QKY78464.1 MuF-like minor capsid protein [Gordonia Phage Zitch]
MRDVAAERAAQQQILREAERSIDAATLAAIGGWLAAFRVALLQELGVPARLVAAADDGVPINAGPIDYALDAAVQRTYGEWANRLENDVMPTVSVAFGDAFQQVRRADPNGAFRLQQEYLAEVSDRLKIWPAGAFEDIRPELIEALSDAATVDEMTDRIGRVLNIDAKTRDLRARINDVEKRLADPDLGKDERRTLKAWRRDLWREHDESLNEWQWKARRIARTEAHGAVSAGQLAAAKLVEQQTGLRMWKRWLSTEDTRTRASHRVADGQTCPLDQPFRVGGFLLEHPADSISVAPHEVINCRCTMLIYDDDELQDEFDEQGGKGDIEPGSTRIGPDDADAADEAIVQVAEREGRAKPQVGQRGEDAGQALPAQPLDVEVTDERDRVPAPDVETATDARLADYLIRTDELEQDELRELVEAELGRRRESEAFEVQYGQPEFADDVIEIDDDGAWLDDPRWADDVPDVEPDDDEIGEVDVDDWDSWAATDDDLPDDSVPADPPDVVEQVIDPEQHPAVVEAQRVYDEAVAEFTAAADTTDEDRINATLAAMDAAEGALAEAHQLAQARDDDGDNQAKPFPDDVTPDEGRGWPWDDDEDDTPTAPRELTDAERREYEQMGQAELIAERDGISYEQALAELRGLDRDQIHRREFVAQGKREGLLSTSFGDMLDEVHRRFMFDWELMAEEATNGQTLKPRYRDSGVTPDVLWRVNDNTARKYMSDEMAGWFDEVGGRITKADLERMIEAGHITFDAEICLGMYRLWSGRRREDYLR